jgi:ribosomal protein S18 acetylase RimI-like enzyme
MIRPVERGDLQRVLDMLVALNDQGTVSDARYRVHPDARERMRSDVLEGWFGAFHPFPPCLVVDLDGAVVAMVSGRAAVDHPIVLREPTAHIETLWVEPAWRRQGWARQLVDAWLAAAVKAGYPRAEVGTLARDDRAVAFWRAVGFDELRVILAADTRTRTSR